MFVKNIFYIFIFSCIKSYNHDLSENFIVQYIKNTYLKGIIDLNIPILKDCGISFYFPVYEEKFFNFSYFHCGVFFNCFELNFIGEIYTSILFHFSKKIKGFRCEGFKIFLMKKIYDYKFGFIFLFNKEGLSIFGCFSMNIFCCRYLSISGYTGVSLLKKIKFIESDTEAKLDQGKLYETEQTKVEVNDVNNETDTDNESNHKNTTDSESNHKNTTDSDSDSDSYSESNHKNTIEVNDVNNETDTDNESNHKNTIEVNDVNNETDTDNESNHKNTTDSDSDSDSDSYSESNHKNTTQFQSSHMFSSSCGLTDCESSPHLSCYSNFDFNHNSGFSPSCGLTDCESSPHLSRYSNFDFNHNSGLNSNSNKNSMHLDNENLWMGKYHCKY